MFLELLINAFYSNKKLFKLKNFNFKTKAFSKRQKSRIYEKMESVVKSDLIVTEGPLLPGESVFMQIYELSKENENTRKNEKGATVLFSDTANQKVECEETETVRNSLESKDQNLEVLELKEGGEEKGPLKRKLSELCHKEDCTFYGKPNPHVFLAKYQKNVKGYFLKLYPVFGSKIQINFVHF